MREWESELESEVDEYHQMVHQQMVHQQMVHPPETNKARAKANDERLIRTIQ